MTSIAFNIEESNSNFAGVNILFSNFMLGTVLSNLAGDSAWLKALKTSSKGLAHEMGQGEVFSHLGYTSSTLNADWELMQAFLHRMLDNSQNLDQEVQAKITENFESLWLKL